MMVSEAEQQELHSSGIPWHRYPNGGNLPAYESSPRLQPYQARGLVHCPGVYHEMSRSDGAIAGVLALRVRELMRADWHIELPLDPTETEQAMARLAGRYLGLDGTYGWMRNGLRRYLYHAHLSTVYGFSPIEYAWDTREMDGRQWLSPSHVSWISPRSVLGWILRAGTQEIVGLLQEVQTRPGAISTRRIVIPATRLINHVHNYVDGNPEGTADIRPCWAWWEAKKGYLVRQVRMEEALANGFLTWSQVLDKEGRPNAAAGKQDQTDLITTSQDIMDGLVFAAIVPSGWKLDKDHPGFDIPSRVDEMTYFDRQIFLALRAVLLGLDASHSGSLALSGATGQLMQNALVGTADEIAEPINGIEGDTATGLLRSLYEANFDTRGQRPPKLVHSGLDHQSTKDFVDAYTKAAQFFAVTPTADDEAIMRRRLDLKEYSTTELDALRKARQDAAQSSQGGTQGGVQSPADAMAAFAELNARVAVLQSDVTRMLEAA
jgi:hypothetical protein